MGLDFGGANTAAVFLALNPNDGRYYVYREYHAGNRTAKAHKDALLDQEPKTPAAYGGAGSEDQWRNEFTAAGLAISPPLAREVEVGIDRVYGLIAQDRLRVFSSCPGLRDEFGSYARELDDEDQPTEKIEDKEKYHRLDALRYIGTYLNPAGGKLRAKQGWVK